MTRPWPDCPECGGVWGDPKEMDEDIYACEPCPTCAAHWRGVEEAVLAEHRNIEAALNTAAAIRAREVKP